MNQAEREQLERRPAALLGEHFDRPALQARPVASATSSTRPAPSATSATSSTRPTPSATSATSSTRPAPVIGQPYDLLALLLLLALLVRE